MLKTYEVSAITAALKRADPKSFIENWYKKCALNDGLQPDKTLVLQGVQLLQTIHNQTPYELPSDVWKRADWYAKESGIQSEDIVRDLLQAFSANGILDSFPPSSEPAINPEIFNSPEAQEILFKMVQENNLNTVNLLIQGGTDLHVSNDQALHLSIIHALDNSLYSQIPDAWHYRASIDHSQTPAECRMMKTLLLHGADPNARDGLFLHKAVVCHNIPVLKILEEAGADIAAYSRPLLQIAQDNHDTAMIDFLKERAYVSDHAMPPKDSPPFKKGVNFSPYDLVMDSRKELVESIKQNLRNDHKLLPPEWKQSAMRPQNPVSNINYLGANRMRLMLAAVKNNYTDPRWCTLKQANTAGWSIKKGSRPILCEKWIFTQTVLVLDENKKPVLDSNNKPLTETISLKNPKVNYFKVFNAAQIDGMPVLLQPELPHSEILTLAEDFISTSECPIREIAQDRAYYSCFNDEIILPLRNAFRSAETFLSVAIHEMGHSTGHPERLNRPMLNEKTSPEYAFEELNAEIGCIFTEADLGIDFDLTSDTANGHLDYVDHWLRILDDDPNSFFRACANAEKISRYLIQNYEYEKELCTTLYQHGYSGTRSLIGNIRLLNKLTGEKHTLDLLHKKYIGQRGEPCLTQVNELIDKIGKDFAQQERWKSLSVIPAAEIGG